MSKVRLYGSIEKVDEQEDGTLIVAGIASTEEVDSQGEIVTRAAMANAIPDYMKFGAVREMHQPMAAGTALKCSVDESGVTHLEAHIVDPVAVKKVLANVYKGFSIGGKVKSRDEVNKNTITGLRLTEISLVDVPANPGAVFTLGKLLADEKVEDAAGFVEKWAGEEIGDASIAINCLSDAFYLLQKEKTEAEPSPEQVVALAAVVENLKTFIASEIKEDNSEKVEKKGARFSKATKDKLGALHKSVNEAKDHLDGLGYDGEDGDGQDDEADPKDKKEDDKTKNEDADDLQKVHADTVAKAEALETELAKVTSENDVLKARVAELEKLPAPAKGAVTAVTKSGEGATSSAPEIQPIRKSDGSIDEVATLIKASHISAIGASR